MLLNSPLLSPLRLACVAAVFVGPIGCGAVDAEPPSTQADAPAALVGQVTLAMHVIDATGPVPDALVVVRTVGSSSEFAPGVLWQAASDARGEVHAALSLRADQRRVEVVVHRTGWSGPWSDDASRVAAGAFAPSSVQEVGVGDLDGFVVAMARGPR